MVLSSTALPPAGNKTETGYLSQERADSEVEGKLIYLLTIMVSFDLSGSYHRKSRGPALGQRP